MDAGFMQRKWLDTRGDEKNLNTFGFISKEGSVASLQTRRAFLVVNTYSIVFAMDKLQKSVPHIRQIVYRLA